MMVICLDDSDSDNYLTKGEVYKVVHIGEKNNRYIIEFEFRVKVFSGHRFEKVSDRRRKTLEELLG